MPAADLLAEAHAARAKAYAPYSDFAVGAAILLTDGRVVHGANLENASYGLSLCAETVALAAVNMAGGMHDVAAIAIVGGATGTDANTPVRPCGRCRQILNEAAQLGGRDIEIFCVGEAHKLSDLLPYAFGPADLRNTP